MSRELPNPDEPLTEYEEALLKKLLSATGQIPPEFWAAIRGKIEVDPPRLVAGELTGIKGEEWREVGATGQPAFQNSWVNFGGSEETAGFYKDVNGIIRLKGLIKSGTLAAAAFTLPEGYRPAKEMRFATPSNGAYGQTHVNASGTVVPTVGNNTYFDLSGISFRAA